MDAYKELYKKSIEDPDTFWAEAASELHWFKHGTRFSTIRKNRSSNGLQEEQQIFATTA